MHVVAMWSAAEAADPDTALSGLVESGLLSWIVLGGVAGAVAKVILPGRDPGGIFGTILIGIAGAFIGGWISSTFLDRTVDNDPFDPAMWVSAIAGSLVLLIGYRIFFGHSRERRRD
jgi:uncharacterized membrane protein YeaQ/YmgE (transglycosylase-associated protein family)